MCKDEKRINTNSQEDRPYTEEVSPAMQQTSSAQGKAALIKKQLKFLTENPLAASLIAGVILAAFGYFHSLSTDLEDVKMSVAVNGISISDLQKETSEMKETINKIDKRYTEFESRLKVVEKANLTVPLLNPTEAASSSINDQLYSIENEAFLLSSVFTTNEVIATNESTKESYTSKQLADEILFLTYQEDGKDVYFFGTFNSNNHWDGDCLINVYDGSELVRITEGIYDDGILLNYRQAFVEPDIKGEPTWYISDRIHTEEYNSGQTLLFDYQKVELDFPTTDISNKNLLFVEDLLIKVQHNLKGFYSGNTANGQYNDLTGKAYYVGYDDNGNIKTLYVGGFKDGDFSDPSHNAWQIGRNVEQNANYMYIRGEFKDGQTVLYDGDYSEHNLTQERIDQIIDESGIDFECPLNWYDPNQSV